MVPADKAIAEPEPEPKDSALVTKEDNRRAAQLGGLVKKIDKEIKNCGKAVRSALEHARKAGNYLLEARKLISHGEWAAWVTDNVKLPLRSAQLYMRIAKRWDELEANTQDLAHLTVEGADKLLRRPNKDKPEPEPIAVEEPAPAEPGSRIPPPWDQISESNLIRTWLDGVTKSRTIEQQRCIVEILEGYVNNLKRKLDGLREDSTPYLPFRPTADA
jgi:hypothetical protein